MPLIPIIAGIGTGLLSVLLLAALLNGSALALPLFIAAPLPIAIVGFTWGPRAALIGAATVLVALLPAAGLIAALAGFLLVALPVALAINLFSLWRDGENGREFYPLGEILLRVAATIGFGLVIVGAVSGFNPEQLSAEMATTMEAWLEEMNMAASTDVARLSDLTFALLPYTVAGFAVAMFVANISLASRIAETSGRTPRPRPPLWSVQMPRFGAYVFAVAALVSLLPGPIGDAGGAVAGAFGVALALVGLGVVHALTFGRPGRSLLIFLAYASIPLLGIPLLLFILLGMVDSFSRIRPPAPVPTST